MNLLKQKFFIKDNEKIIIEEDKSNNTEINQNKQHDIENWDNI